MNTRKDVFVSVVMIRPDIDHFHDDLIALSNILSSSYLHHEIVVTNPVSSKGIPEEKIDAALKQIQHIRYIKIFSQKADASCLSDGLSQGYV